MTTCENFSIDWTVKETMRAQLRLFVKRALKEPRYPPSGQEEATKTVLQHAELLYAGWA